MITRSLLAKAFPDNPRLRAEFEALADFLDSARAEVATLLQSAADASGRLSALENEGAQPFSGLLDAIATAPDNELGVFEKVGEDEVILRQVDSNDDACLVPRSKLVSYVGKGSTAARPVLSTQRRALYFDTTLAANGKPVFWTGTAWVDSAGTSV